MEGKLNTAEHNKAGLVFSLFAVALAYIYDLIALTVSTLVKLTEK